MTNRREQCLVTGATLADLVVSDHQHLFRAGTGTTESLRGGGYDLRMATDLMVVPEAAGNESYLIYDRGHHRAQDVILGPGDTALVSTVERFCFDFGLSGNIGPKFSLAARGLLVLTGLAVDPGYGRDAVTLVPMEDQRVHFVVANVGPAPIVLRPGAERIAFLQIFRVEPEATPRPSRSVGFDALREQLFENDTNQGAGLLYFRNVHDVAKRVNSVEDGLEKLEAKVRAIETASNNVVLFGVFLVAATILGVLTALLLQAVTALPGHLGARATVAVMAVAAGYAIAIGLVVAIVLRRLK